MNTTTTTHASHSADPSPPPAHFAPFERRASTQRSSSSATFTAIGGTVDPNRGPPSAHG